MQKCTHRKNAQVIIFFDSLLYDARKCTSGLFLSRHIISCIHNIIRSCMKPHTFTLIPCSKTYEPFICFGFAGTKVASFLFRTLTSFLTQERYVVVQPRTYIRICSTLLLGSKFNVNGNFYYREGPGLVK